MRKIKSGLIEWGPKEYTCYHCRDVWEVTKEDLIFWTITTGGNPHDWCEEFVAGWECPTCSTKNRISDLDRIASVLHSESLRRKAEIDAYQGSSYWEHQ